MDLDAVGTVGSRSCDYVVVDLRSSGLRSVAALRAVLRVVEPIPRRGILLTGFEHRVDPFFNNAPAGSESPAVETETPLTPCDIKIAYPDAEITSLQAGTFEVALLLGDDYKYRPARSPALRSVVSFDGPTLQKHAGHIQKLGYVFVPSFYSPAAIEYMRGWADAWAPEPADFSLPYRYFAHSSKTGAEELTRVERFLDCAPEFDNALLDGQVIHLIQTCFQGECPTLFKEKINYKLGSGGPPDLLHQDNAAGWLKYLDGEKVLTFVLFLDDNTEENAPVYVLKGGKYPRKLMGPEFEPLPNAGSGFPRDEFEPLIGPAGSFALFDGYIPHGSESNTSPFHRRNIYITFTAGASHAVRQRYYQDKLESFPPNSMRKADRSYAYRV